MFKTVDTSGSVSVSKDVAVPGRSLVSEQDTAGERGVEQDWFYPSPSPYIATIASHSREVSNEGFCCVQLAGLSWGAELSRGGRLRQDLSVGYFGECRPDTGSTRTTRRVVSLKQTPVGYFGFESYEPGEQD
ncbi:hypothetical protein NDU88_006896 [Pleurodeles waltl]|uniref:Uncharacterized protein n=1 Tax=Pleurodeles waltl TaxID=8319 RepID=A0AAV7SR85_PLEWA|nr:hypothetical protein NDU88_006896 [Pleurodeles waltl]